MEKQIVKILPFFEACTYLGAANRMLKPSIIRQIFHQVVGTQCSSFAGSGRLSSC